MDDDGWEDLYESLAYEAEERDREDYERAVSESLEDRDYATRWGEVG